MKANALKIAMTAVLAGSVLTGCASMSGLFGTKKKDDVITTADKTEQQYYDYAQESIAKSHNNEAVIALNNIRTFYPTGRLAEQALLDLIYVQYQQGNYEAVTQSTAEYIRLYPTSRNIDYALYVQGVTNMNGAPKGPRLYRVNQAERNTAYLRLAFQDFQSLVNNYPNSTYAADAAQRMVAIYNALAENELVAARWYIKRDAMVAAANRAKWVFQYFPQSESVPEAVAILAYTNEQLGLTETSNEYKTLLQINYPQYLSNDGTVRLSGTGAKTTAQKVLSAISFGKLGRASDAPAFEGQYAGQTRTQSIRQAQALRLPETNESKIESSNNSLIPENQRRLPNLNLGLPSDTDTGNVNNIPH